MAGESTAQGIVGDRPRIQCDRGKILKLHAAGLSFANIASKLGLTKSTVCRIVGGRCLVD
jgi:hypothetical protein